MKIIKKKYLEENKLLIEAINNWNAPFYFGDENDWFEEILLKENRKIFDEGLIKTYNQDFVGNRLSEYGQVLKVENKLYLQLKSIDDIEYIKKYVNTLGYFVAQYKILFKDIEKSPTNYVDYKNSDEFLDKLNDIKELWIVIEPKFDKISDSENINFIYHLTEKVYLDKIRTKGLIPKSKSKKAYHPDRIYVVTELNKLSSILEHFTKNGKNINGFIVLKIDYSLANKPKLYNDPNYLTYGYYIIDNINPNAIIEVIDANEILK